MNNQERKRASDDASDGPDQPIDARPLRCTDGLIDPLLERLKQVHGDPRVAAQADSCTAANIFAIRSPRRHGRATKAPLRVQVLSPF